MCKGGWENINLVREGKKRAKSDERKIGTKASERGWREGKERPIYCTNKQKYVKERRLRCNRERDTG